MRVTTSRRRNKIIIGRKRRQSNAVSSMDEAHEDYLERRRLKIKKIAVLAACIATYTVEHTPPVVRDRLDWDLHVDQLHREGEMEFYRMYRMSAESFAKLADMIRPHFVKNVHMANVRSEGKGPITTELSLHCLLRYLAGSDHRCIRILGGMSRRSFYRAVHRGFRAILSVDELGYHFPTTNQEIYDSSRGFLKLSNHDVIAGTC